MVRIFDEDDYRRRLDEAGEISTADEASLLLKGALTGTGFAPPQCAAGHSACEAGRVAPHAEGNAARDPR
jgi:hypothetical protein